MILINHVIYTHPRVLSSNKKILHGSMINEWTYYSTPWKFLKFLNWYDFSSIVYGLQISLAVPKPSPVCPAFKGGLNTGSIDIICYDNL